MSRIQARHADDSSRRGCHATLERFAQRSLRRCSWARRWSRGTRLLRLRRRRRDRRRRGAAWPTSARSGCSRCSPSSRRTVVGGDPGSVIFQACRSRRARRAARLLSTRSRVFLTGELVALGAALGDPSFRVISPAGQVVVVQPGPLRWAGAVGAAGAVEPRPPATTCSGRRRFFRVRGRERRADRQDAANPRGPAAAPASCGASGTCLRRAGAQRWSTSTRSSGTRRSSTMARLDGDRRDRHHHGHEP